jgi:alpha-mannosidase
MFGTEELRKEGKEAVFQKWCGLSEEKSRFYVINSGTYGGSFDENEIRISLLRTAVYAAHPVDDVEFVPDTRIYNHIDMGERFFSFRLLADEEFIDYEAEKFNQKPYVLSVFPSGSGELPKDGAEIDNKNILLSAFRKTDKGMLIRLYNSKDCEQKCKLFYDGAEYEICFGKFEVKTFIKIGDKLTETNMLGE